MGDGQTVVAQWVEVAVAAVVAVVVVVVVVVVGVVAVVVVVVVCQAKTQTALGVADPP